jgi:hypothetical protein
MESPFFFVGLAILFLHIKYICVLRDRMERLSAANVSGEPDYMESRGQESMNVNSPVSYWNPKDLTYIL